MYSNGHLAWSVSRSRDDADSRHDLRFTLNQIELVSERREVVPRTRDQVLSKRLAHP